MIQIPGQTTIEILNFKVGYNHDTKFKLPTISTFESEAHIHSHFDVDGKRLSSDLTEKVHNNFCHSQLSLYPVRAFCIKPTLICLYGIDKNQVTQIAAQIRQIRPPSTYTRKGLFIVTSP